MNDRYKIYQDMMNRWTLYEVHNGGLRRVAMFDCKADAEFARDCFAAREPPVDASTTA